MSYFGSTAWYQRVSNGEVPGHRIVRGLGEREDVGTTASGEDIWLGSATTIPTPLAIGEQMSIVSSSASDTSAGTGSRTVEVRYLDANGDEGIEVVTMNGTTAVNLTETNIRFINDMYSTTVGTDGVAAGDITIYKTGSPTTIYNMIATGGNKSLVLNRMVPLGHTLTVIGWHATEAQGKRQSIRIRSTDMNGILIPGVFCFKDVAFINQTTTGQLDMFVKVPALSIIKVSSWALVAGGEVSCSMWGVLIAD